MTKQEFVEHITERGRQRGLDRDLLASMVEMYAEYVWNLAETVGVILDKQAELNTVLNNLAQSLTISALTPAEVAAKIATARTTKTKSREVTDTNKAHETDTASASA